MRSVASANVSTDFNQFFFNRFLISRILSEISAADLVVGKAAALLMTGAGVTCVFAKCVSEAGLEVLKSHGIACSYDVIAEKIMNRDGTDVCPMEKTVQNIDDHSAALVAIKQKLAELMQKSRQNR